MIKTSKTKHISRTRIKSQLEPPKLQPRQRRKIHNIPIQKNGNNQRSNQVNPQITRSISLKSIKQTKSRLRTRNNTAYLLPPTQPIINIQPKIFHGVGKNNNVPSNNKRMVYNNTTVTPADCNIKLHVIDYGVIASAGKLHFNGSSPEFLGWFEGQKKRLVKKFGKEVFFLDSGRRRRNINWCDLKLM
jgi:hypothetical protein